MMKRKMVFLDQTTEVVVVRHHPDHVRRQRADAVAVQQIVQTVPESRHQQQDTRLPSQIVHLQIHGELVADASELVAHLWRRQPRRVHADPHEELLAVLIAELGAFDDVALEIEQDPAHGGNDTDPVGA